ncbi:hypothetical protein [Rathayibacter sp. SD072]|uniref:hypothetical protein n=1 Tax=Rathayibacter sp. SD072 TaxID=2781731 RepID=UPI001A962E11|nr:hypothetical protein [Rathayibacter sp. SD072]MBO0982965.1 hypothetical protein [Rathayibacter sp. SD072]
MRFSTTMHQVGRTTGIEVPPEVIAALGGTHVTAIEGAEADATRARRVAGVVEKLAVPLPPPQG